MSRYPQVLSAIICYSKDRLPGPLFDIRPLWSFVQNGIAVDIGPRSGWYEAAREHRLLADEAVRTLQSDYDPERLIELLAAAVPSAMESGYLRTFLASDSPFQWAHGRHDTMRWVYHFADVFKVVELSIAVDSPTKRPSIRSTKRGDAQSKLIAALTKHHQYADGGCLNLNPIGNNELAKLADVSTSTASAFFNDKFQAHTKYKTLCRDAGKLTAALKLLNDEFAPYHLLGDASSDLAAPEPDDADSES